MPNAREERLTAEQIAEIRAVLDYGGPISNAAGRALLDAAERVEALERALVEAFKEYEDGFDCMFDEICDRNGIDLENLVATGTPRTPQPGDTAPTWRKVRKKPVEVEARNAVPGEQIQTLEGVMTANAGDYIIRGVKGECYPVKPDIFAATYDDPLAAQEPTPWRDAWRDEARAEINRLRAEIERELGHGL